MPTELFSPLMTAREARLKTPLALAYVGDTVWDLLVRRSLLRSGEKAGALHRLAVQLVNAAAQARASREIDLEKKKALEDVKTEIVSIASLMAGKAVAASMDVKIQDSLIQETLKEMGESTWQS